MTVTGQPRTFPFTPSDSFILALDGLCHRSWGGCLSACTEIEIEGTPDREKFLWLARELPRRLPLLRATLHRGILLAAPSWRISESDPAIPLPLDFHRTADVPGDENVVASPQELRTRMLTLQLHENGRPPHLRLDVVRHHSARWLLIITWSHILLDGTGIEHLVRAMARFWDDPAAALPQDQPVHPESSVWQRFQDSEAIGKYLFQLSGRHFPSASRSRIAVGSPRHLVETFSADESRRSRAVLQSIGGELMAVFFHAVIAARAHRTVLHARGIRGATLLLGVPAQLRARTSAGEPAIFQNHMTMLYYALDDAELDDIATACRLVMRQNVEHLRKKHHLSFHAFLSLARHLPGRLMLKLVRWQQRGEFVSLFHSWTGTFAPGLHTAFGGRLLNAYHIPGVSAPPGSGLFFSDCQGRDSLVLSWVVTCLSADEVNLMRQQWRHDLLGEASP